MRDNRHVDCLFINDLCGLGRVLSLYSYLGHSQNIPGCIFYDDLFQVLSDFMNRFSFLIFLFQYIKCYLESLFSSEE